MAKTMTGEQEDGGEPKEEFIAVDKPLEEAAEAQGEDHDEEEGGGERTVKRDEEGGGGDGEDRAAIQARRRQEKIERKERQEAARRRNQIEMDYLRKRNDELERRMVGVETHTAQRQLSDIDAQLLAAQREFEMSETVIAKAAAANNGEDMVKAMRYRDGARDRLQQLSAFKAQATQQPQRQQAQPQVDPQVLRHAQDFMDENEWYNINGTDEDSAVVLAIDGALVREGLNPKSKEYWVELRKRAAKRLPERFAGQRDGGEGQQRQRGGPQLGSRSEHAPQSTRREVYISPARKQALIDMGAWDDPVLRARMVKRYSEYDRENKDQR